MRHPGIYNKTSCIRRRISLLVMAAYLLLFPLVALQAADGSDEEIKIGKEAAEQVAKESKFIEDPNLVQRLETIGKAIAAVAKDKEVPARYGKPAIGNFDYTFKIIDDKEINAFSLPGGYVYVNKGLLDYVQSDDELAGVIAHEIVHTAHHHAMQLMKAQDKAMLGIAAGLLIAATAGAKGSDLGNLANLGYIVSMAKMSGYGQKAEVDADRTAVVYLSHTGYNPVGMLTFMERLARDELRKPSIEFGIFATHPPAYMRAKEITAELESCNIPINRRLVTTYMRVQVKPSADLQSASVWISETEIVRLADSGGQKASDRAEHIATDLSNVLLEGARMHDVKLGGNGTSVVVAGKVIVLPTEEDAVLAGKSVPQVAAAAYNSIKRALMNEMLEGRY
jgi:beta-barrel assembly-enhancing protease